MTDFHFIITSPRDAEVKRIGMRSRFFKSMESCSDRRCYTLTKNSRAVRIPQYRGEYAINTREDLEG